MSEVTSPRPGNWREEHMRSYLETNGEKGHIWNGVPTLLLTTTGRKSGKQYTTPLIYGKDGDRYLIVGSRGGAAHHPQWYLNIEAKPEIEVQVLGDKFKARAYAAQGDEKARLWKMMAALWPAYDDYQAKTRRDIPLVVIERA
jgi:deazaflavin-dependent oxidoreductase (nitroreductase family)